MPEIKKLLIVARWPLGGIRTYLRYMFTPLSNRYEITLLVASTQEDEALKKDANLYAKKLIIVNINNSFDFSKEINKEISKSKYQLIISQGFISAVSVFPVNFIRRIPHILTIHGVVESKYLEGQWSFIKTRILYKALKNVTVLYAVSNDILDHLYDQFPKLKINGPKSAVIYNGIDVTIYNDNQEQPKKLRESLGIDSSVFLFGFFGRFMPQKGFDLLIEAVGQLKRDHSCIDFRVVAVGSGDYIKEYKSLINEKGLADFFFFLPFQPSIHHIYSQVDAVVMPSRWEACPLQPMEALCAGAPLIASECIGTREIITDTPAFVCARDNADELSLIMLQCMKNNRISDFSEFKELALLRFNVTKSVKELDQLINTFNE